MGTINNSLALWYEDGNIIIQAEDTLFRVYRGILCQNSTVFRDILSIPQSPTEECFDGCPIIRVSDSSKDISSLLLALYRPGGPLPTEFADFAGLLELSIKYGIRHLHRRAISHLSECYPSTLIDWDRRRATSFPPFAVLDLARSMNIQEILPAVFLECATQSPHALSECATKSDLLTCLTARQDLFEATFIRIYEFLRHLWFACAHTVQCTQTRHDYLGNTMAATNGWAPLSVEVQWKRLDALCQFCKFKSQVMHRKAREKLWDDLPSFFKLPPWEELLAQRSYSD